MDANDIAQRLTQQFGERIVATELEVPNPFVVVATEAIAEVAAFAKSEADLAFDNLMCLSAVDYHKEDPPRMEVVYSLFSYKHQHVFTLKVHLPREEASVPTVEKTWGVANWHEREAFDLFGISFAGHSDLRRILLPDDWEGHPLRKDWEDPEQYNGMRVKVTESMAQRAEDGESLGTGPFDDTPPNRHLEEAK